MADTTGQATDGKPAQSYDSSVSELREELRKFKSVRDRFVPDWYLNSAFFAGQQWTYWNRTRLDKVKVAPGRPEPITDNRILPTVTSRVARKVKNRPAFVATPRTGDEDDINSAQLTEKVLEDDWNTLELQHKLYLAQLWADICSAGFWKLYWDPSRGEKSNVVVDAQGNPQQQTNGRMMRPGDFATGLPEGLGQMEVAQGDVCVDVISPFEFFPHPLATSLDDCEEAFEEKVRSVEYVRQRYGEEVEPDTDAPVGTSESRMFGWYTGSSAEYRGVKVTEYWARPSSKFPQGKRCVWAGQKVLYEDSKPFDPMPYVMFSGIKVPGRFWPTSIVTQLRGPQTELNKLESQIQENAMRLGNPSLLTSRHANVEYKGVPGERVYYDSTVPDAVPSYLQPPEIPGYVREQIDRITNAMQEISGTHEVSNAQVPAGVTAASAINLLQEADDTRLGPEIQDMERSLGVAGTKVAKLRASFCSDERLLKIAGDDGDWDIQAYRGTMMGQDPQVEVQAGSAMPRSKAAKQAAMMEILQTAFQYGLQFDPRDLRRFFKDYEVASLDRLFETISATETQVQRENRQLKAGEAVPLHPYDDDEQHIEGHEEFQRGVAYERLPDNIKQIVQTHIDAHREKIVQQTNMQVAQQQANGTGAQGQMTSPEGGLYNPAGSPSAISQ